MNVCASELSPYITNWNSRTLSLSTYKNQYKLLVHLTFQHTNSPASLVPYSHSDGSCDDISFYKPPDYAFLDSTCPVGFEPLSHSWSVTRCECCVYYLHTLQIVVQESLSLLRINSLFTSPFRVSYRGLGAWRFPTTGLSSTTHPIPFKISITRIQCTCYIFPPRQQLVSSYMLSQKQ